MPGAQFTSASSCSQLAPGWAPELTTAAYQPTEQLLEPVAARSSQPHTKQPQRLWQICDTRGQDLPASSNDYLPPGDIVPQIRNLCMEVVRPRASRSLVEQLALRRGWVTRDSPATLPEGNRGWLVKSPFLSSP